MRPSVGLAKPRFCPQAELNHSDESGYPLCDGRHAHPRAVCESTCTSEPSDVHHEPLHLLRNRCAVCVVCTQVTDIVDFIGAPWASALFHDKFPAFRAALVGMVQEVGGGTPEMDAYQHMHTVSEVQDSVIDFVRMHMSELIAYNIPLAA